MPRIGGSVDHGSVRNRAACSLSAWSSANQERRAPLGFVLAALSSAHPAGRTPLACQPQASNSLQQPLQQQQQGRAKKKESSSSHLDIGKSWFLLVFLSKGSKGSATHRACPEPHEMTTPLCGLSPQHPGIVRTTWHLVLILSPQQRSRFLF